MSALKLDRQHVTSYLKSMIVAGVIGAVIMAVVAVMVESKAGGSEANYSTNTMIAKK